MGARRIVREFSVGEIKRLHDPHEWARGIDVHRHIWTCFVFADGSVERVPGGMEGDFLALHDYYNKRTQPHLASRKVRP